MLSLFACYIQYSWTVELVVDEPAGGFETNATAKLLRLLEQTIKFLNWSWSEKILYIENI